MTTVRCGTNSGYERHLKQGEPTCQPCREAHATWKAQYRRRNPQSAARDAARNRAMARLRENHADEWAALYDEERTLPWELHTADGYHSSYATQDRAHAASITLNLMPHEYRVTRKDQAA